LVQKWLKKAEKVRSKLRKKQIGNLLQSGGKRKITQAKSKWELQSLAKQCCQTSKQRNMFSRLTNGGKKMSRV
jgi:hypothetical protein